MKALQYKTGWDFDTFLYKNYGFSTTSKQKGIALAQFIHFLDGDCSGKVEVSSYQELTSTEAAKELLAQGSDPEFFNLDQEGRSLDDDLIGYQVEEYGNNSQPHPAMEASFCVYNWSQCKEMVGNDTGYWKIVPVMKDTIEEPTLMFEGDPND